MAMKNLIEELVNVYRLLGGTDESLAQQLEEAENKKKDTEFMRELRVQWD